MKVILLQDIKNVGKKVLRESLNIPPNINIR